MTKIRSNIELFAHRGFLVNKRIKENSLDAIKYAYKNKFKAVEIDIWFIKNQFYLCHNKPIKIDNLDKLEEVFNKFNNKLKYWLDFKNLNRKNHKIALKKLNYIIIKEKINMNNIYFAPYITNFNNATFIYKEFIKIFGYKNKIIAVKSNINKYQYYDFRNKLYDNNIYGISIHYSNIDINFKNFFDDFEIFAWTVNSFKKVLFLNKILIRNIATDKIKPKFNDQ